MRIRSQINLIRAAADPRSRRRLGVQNGGYRVSSGADTNYSRLREKPSALRRIGGDIAPGRADACGTDYLS